MNHKINRKMSHPGEILKEEFLVPMKLTQTDLALGIGMEYRTVNELVNGKRGITANTALRLSRYFGTSPELWLNLQAQYDLWNTEQKIKKDLDKITARKAS